MINIFSVEGKYGIKDNQIIIVPPTHDSSIGAIEEWAYFERLNIEKHFLEYEKTEKEIDEMVDRLKSSMIFI